MVKKTFKRIEKKYLITVDQYNAIIETIHLHTEEDPNRRDRVFSLYFDTPNDLLIRRSIDKPVYKEKLRLRAYGTPDDESQVFAEIKKKYKKVVYKRRAVMKYGDAKGFLTTGIIPDGYDDQHQILSEIKWFLTSYEDLAPSMLISYDRSAFFGTEDSGLRITFDSNMSWRECRSFPAEGAGGTPLIDDRMMIMEIKIPGSMPLWLAHLLADNKIYPTSFSKVGTAYKQKHSKER